MGRNKTGYWVCCSYCGKEKYVSESKYIRNKNFFCKGHYRLWLLSDNNNQRDRVEFICDYCGEKKERQKAKIFKNNFCNNECKFKFNRESNSATWRGGPNVTWYNTYASSLSIAEEIRRDPQKKNYLQVKCAYCDQWFNPPRRDVDNRVRSLNGDMGGENRLYCNNACKQSCNIYNQKLYPKGFKPATSREVQPELRKLVLERDEWTCIRCKAGIEKELHCHHIEGIEQNPIMSADIDMCVTLCKDCHHDVHREKDCRYHELRRKQC